MKQFTVRVVPGEGWRFPSEYPATRGIPVSAFTGAGAIIKARDRGLIERWKDHEAVLDGIVRSTGYPLKIELLTLLDSPWWTLYRWLPLHKVSFFRRHRLLP